MRRPQLITEPFVTPEETAEVLGVPRRRAQELSKAVKESLARKGYLTAVDGNHSVSYMKRGTSSTHSSRAATVEAKRRTAKSNSASRRKRARGKAKTAR